MTLLSSITTVPDQDTGNTRESRLVEALKGRSIVLVGMMGAGKTSVGKRLAARLQLSFMDADSEIELAAKMTVAEIFDRHGEAYFRDGERRVLLRMLNDGCRVLATGGGAFMNSETRSKIVENGLSVWLKADIDVLMRRLRRRQDRPLLQGADLETTLIELMKRRDPVYAEAQIIVKSGDTSQENVLEDVLSALESHLDLKESYL